MKGRKTTYAFLFAPADLPSPLVSLCSGMLTKPSSKLNNDKYVFFSMLVFVHLPSPPLRVWFACCANDDLDILSNAWTIRKIHRENMIGHIGTIVSVNIHQVRLKRFLKLWDSLYFFVLYKVGGGVYAHYTWKSAFRPEKRDHCIIANVIAVSNFSGYDDKRFMMSKT